MFVGFWVILLGVFLDSASGHLDSFLGQVCNVSQSKAMAKIPALTSRGADMAATASDALAAVLRPASLRLVTVSEQGWKLW